MKIYKLKREGWIHELVGVMVVAGDEDHARKLAAEEAGEEGPDVWLSPSSGVTCVELGTAHPDVEAEVLMHDYLVV